MVTQIILFPFGGNAREALNVILDINRHRRQWDVIGFIDDDPGVSHEEYLGVKVLGDGKMLKKYSECSVLAVPGNPKNYSQRKLFIDRLDLVDSRFARIIHPSAVIGADVQIGFNTLVLANVVMTSRVTIGNHCVVLPNTTVSHDTVVGDYCCIGTNVSIAGQVFIGESCYLGSGSNIREKIKVGRGALVGLGSNVVKDVDEHVTVIGNPAKILENHK